MNKLLILFIFLPLFCFGQKQANIWYFGNDGAGLDFNSCTPRVLTDGKIMGFEGCATISDNLTGQLLFCTNSEWVWNRNQDTIPNSHLVTNGNTITQVMVIQKPSSSSLYYIITSEIQGFSGQGYQFHSIDMTMNGGLGGIAFKDSLLYLSPVTEKITAVRHANGNDIWIIGHQYNSNKFLSFLVTSSGINTNPVISLIGKINYDASTADAIGELKASPDGSKLAAVTLVHPNIELFDFNNSTGQISNLITLPEIGGYDILGNACGLYGLSFSPNSSMLYASQWLLPSSNTSGKIIQYNITSNDSATISNSRMNVFASNSESIYSLKLAPDGKIYVGHNTTSNYLGVINFPDSTGLSCNYVDSGVYLAGKHSGWGLNNLMEYQNYTDNCACKNITATINGKDTICSGSTVELDASGGVTYSWSNGATGATINVNPTSTTTYTVTGVNGTCTNTATVKVFVNFPPNVSITGNSNICSGQNTTLTASGGATYTWNTSATTTTIIVSPNTLTTYTVTATNSCGTASTSISVAVNVPPTITTSPNLNICMGSSTTINANGANTYTWSPAIGLSSTMGASVTANPISTTTYTVTGSDGTCSNSTTITITIDPNPIVNAGTDTTIFSGDSIMLKASGGGTYSWNPTTGLNCDTCKNPIVKPLSTTDYCVTAISTNGCTATDCATITVKNDIKCGEIFIPNAFSPDNNGENDMECVFGNCIQTMQFSIYDRWGEKVFESTNPKFCWNGFFNGKPMNTGVFVYYFNATLTTGEKITKKGNISLIR